jgi:hypothetical protein
MNEVPSMARICPQCSQIHFETSTEPMPTRCRRCEADLNGFGASAIPIDEADANKSNAPPPQNGKMQFLIGFLLLTGCGGCVWYGLKEHNEAVEATATVVSYNKSMTVPKGTNRNDAVAQFNVGSTRVYTYPGVRAGGDSFKVYYSPGKPESASEQRPFLFFVAAGFMGLIGGAMSVLGLSRFFISRAQHKDFNRIMKVTQG